MADTKTTGLTEHIGPPVDNDMLYMADVSDTTMAASGTSKKNQAKNYLRTNGTANTLGANLAANGYNFTGAGTVSTAAALAANYYGGTVSGGTVVISSTTHATKGKILFGAASAFDEANNRWGLGTVDPVTRLHIVGDSYVDGAYRVRQSGSTAYRSEWAVIGGIANINAYNESGAAYIQFYIDGSQILLRANGSSTDYVAVSSTGDLVINDGNLLLNNGRLGEAWANAPSFNTGWGNYGGGEQVAQYKKVGDLVFLRGLVARSSGSQTTIFTLPSGYRPPAYSRFRQSSNTGDGQIDVAPTGEIVFAAGGAGWISLDRIVFSTV